MRASPLAVALTAAVTLAVAPLAAQSLQLINPPGMSNPATYSHVVRAGKTLYIAGQVGADAAGTIAGDTMAAQLTQVLANLKTVLASQGAEVRHIAKINIFVTDMTGFRAPDATKIRADFFNGHKPASTLVEVARLASPEYKVEIEAIAVLP